MHLCYTGRDLGFVDAVSFAAMKRERVEGAFAFDRCFLIMDFRTVSSFFPTKPSKHSRKLGTTVSGLNPFQGF